MKSKLTEYFILTLGTVLTAIGIYFFKMPNNFTVGGVSGISVILGAISHHLTPGMFILGINTLLLAIGFIFVSAGFGFKTFYCTIVLSLLVYLLEIVYPLSKPLTNQPLLELIFAIFLPGIGSALIFNHKASTGGTDIVAMIIKKYFSINIAKALLYADILVVIGAAFVFGIQTWLFSVLGLFAKVFVVDKVVEFANTSKCFTIITEHGQEIAEYITNTLKRGATINNAYEGAFSEKPKSVIITALNRKQAIRLKEYIKSIDVYAFIIVNSTSDIIGKGFKERV